MAVLLLSSWISVLPSHSLPRPSSLRRTCRAPYESGRSSRAAVREDDDDGTARVGDGRVPGGTVGGLAAIAAAGTVDATAAARAASIFSLFCWASFVDMLLLRAFRARERLGEGTPDSIREKAVAAVIRNSGALTPSFLGSWGQRNAWSQN